jgi:hypothetical protein
MFVSMKLLFLQLKFQHGIKLFLILLVSDADFRTSLTVGIPSLQVQLFHARIPLTLQSDLQILEDVLFGVEFYHL